MPTESPKGHSLGGFVLRGRAQSEDHVTKRVAAIKSSLQKTTRQCVECGEDYHPTSPPQKYCSGRCAKAVATRKVRKSEPRIYIAALEYATMLVAQQGKCAICGFTPETDRRKLCVDHCHATKKIRGLLCHRCNTAIGLLRDDPVVLESAVRYLTQ